FCCVGLRRDVELHHSRVRCGLEPSVGPYEHCIWLCGYCGVFLAKSDCCAQQQAEQYGWRFHIRSPLLALIYTPGMLFLQRTRIAVDLARNEKGADLKPAPSLRRTYPTAASKD